MISYGLISTQVLLTPSPMAISRHRLICQALSEADFTDTEVS